MPLLRFLVSDAIFCLRELIRTVKLYEPGYIVGFSYLGAAHRKLGYWCNANDNLRLMLTKAGKKEEAATLKEKVIDLIGKNALVYLEPNYQFEMAVQTYYRAIQMHTEGRAYKAYILNLYLLEDDFNDNLTHFSLAMERMRVNLGEARSQIDKTKALINGDPSKEERCCKPESGSNTNRGSRLHQYHSYYPAGALRSEPEAVDSVKCQQIVEVLLPDAPGPPPD